MSSPLSSGTSSFPVESTCVIELPCNICIAAPNSSSFTPHLENLSLNWLSLSREYRQHKQGLILRWAKYQVYIQASQNKSLVSSFDFYFPGTVPASLLGASKLTTSTLIFSSSLPFVTMATQLPMAATRQPFAPLLSSRLQNLTSLKNRQNGMLMQLIRSLLVNAHSFLSSSWVWFIL